MVVHTPDLAILARLRRSRALESRGRKAVMEKIYRYSALVAMTVAAACATSTPNSGFTGQSVTGGNGSTSGGGNSGSVGTLAGSGGNGSTTLVGAGGNGNPNRPDSGNDAGLVLGADGGVVGTCVVGRGMCDDKCDDLAETMNGQPTHEYIEPNPDDGSPLPPGPATSLDAKFNGASSTGGPCIIDPPDGSLFPNNWLRPRIYFAPAAAGTNYYQIRIHADRQLNDLVVYTESVSWEIPKDIWTALAASTWGEDITVTVSEVPSAGGTATSSQVKFQIAPALANGSMIYWAAVGDTNGFSWLEGFRVADEGVSRVLTAPTGPFAAAATNVTWTWSRDSGGNLSNTNRDTQVALTPTGDAQCIGCHVAVPDGTSVAFLDFYPWDGVTSSVNTGNVGQPPAWLTPGGAETLSQGWLGMLAFSSSVWNSGSHLVVSSSQIPESATNVNPWGVTGGDMNATNLVWIDLSTAAAPTFVTAGTTTPLPSAGSINASPYYTNKNTTFGFIERGTGDPNSASTPAWSHSGTQIVYASNNAPISGRLGVGVSDLYTLPFDPVGKVATAAAAKLQGASSSTANEYYPAFSPDDKYIAFNSAPPGKAMYYNADAEIYVVPSTGGTSTRLKANDPAACMKGQGGAAAVSPGVTNSWARWSPEFPTCTGKTYYWLIFSSSRLGLPFQYSANPKNFKLGTAPAESTSQLYLTGIVDDGSGNLTTYPATYIWNQPITASAGAAKLAQSNHTPAWEVVEIQPPAPAPPPQPPPPPR